VSDDREKLLEEVLKERLVRLTKAIDSLRIAYERANGIGIKDQYNENELTVFDALTGRFIRACDVLMAGVWGAFDKIEREEGGTFLDRINRAEKRGIISSAREFKDIRDLRNTIVHEYVITEQQKLYQEVLRLTPLLLNAERTAVEYRDKKLKF